MDGGSFNDLQVREAGAQRGRRMIAVECDMFYMDNLHAGGHYDQVTRSPATPAAHVFYY